MRGFRRNPGLSITAVLTLALGIGATTGMFAVMRAALWKPLPFADPERLVLPRTSYNGHDNDWASAPDFFDYREQANCFETPTAMNYLGKIVVKGAEAEHVRGALIAPAFFQMPGIPPVAGRWPGCPIVVKIGSAEVLVECRLQGDSLIVDLAHIEGGGEGVLLTLPAKI